MPTDTLAPWWTEFRNQMPVARNWAYLDHAAVAPLSEPARAAMCQWAEDITTEGDVCWRRWSRRVQEVRILGAKLVGAAEAELALVRNTTEGITLVAECFPWQAGDNVVTFAGEFPSNLYPWMNLARRGVEIRRVPTELGRVNLDDVAAACDRRTRIVAVSWVGYATGWRNDLDRLAEIAHASGALLFVDAIQGLGVFPLDVRTTRLDFFAADGHKWLLGPEGAGLLFIRTEHLERLAPLGVGWNSVVHAGQYDNSELILRTDAARYEGGSYNVAGLVALGASLKLLASFGAEPISQRVLTITDLACERLREIGAVVVSHRDLAHASSIVAFELPGKDAHELLRRCHDQKVTVRVRAGRLRISPHAYNNEEDIERLVAALR